MKNIFELKIIIQVTTEVLHRTYRIQNISEEISVVFHNKLNYD